MRLLVVEAERMIVEGPGTGPAPASLRDAAVRAVLKLKTP
jgi:hypothetical protein